jgi:hypothetical protein
LNNRRASNLEEISGMLLNPDPKKWGAYSVYVNFATNRFGQLPSGTTAGSIENIHNKMHGMVGGDPRTEGDTRGQMGNPSIAAFDPVFWFHHA